MNIADNIYKIIQDRHLKQSSLAKAAGYNPKTFNNLLRGRKIITANDIMPICKVLQITPNELFNYKSNDIESSGEAV